MSKNTTTGPFGFPLPDKVAREADAAVKAMPKSVRERFKTTVRDAAGKRVAVEGYARRETTVKAVDFNDGEHADISVITSDSVDRDQEVVLPRGLDFSQFQKNPVVTFCHDYFRPPVGKCLWVKMESMQGGGECWKAKTQYTSRPAAELLPADEEWLPDVVWHYVREGYMPGKSIGFIPLEYGEFTPDEIRANPAWADAKRGVVRRAMVLEYSACPVQANIDSLVESVAKMRAKGIASKSLIDALGLVIPDAMPATKAVVTKPKPREDESESDFVMRCIPVVLSDGSAESQEQAVAMCHSIWQDNHKAATFIRPETFTDVAERRALAALAQLPERVAGKVLDNLYRAMGKV